MLLMGRRSNRTGGGDSRSPPRGLLGSEGPAGPVRMRATGNLVRQRDAAHGAVGEAPRIDHDAFGRAGALVRDEAQQIAVVLIARSDTRCERRLARVPVRAEVQLP